MTSTSSLDSVKAVARVAKVALALGIERLRPTRAAELPFDASRLSCEWLSHALSLRTPGVRVRSYELVDSHAGTTARARLVLDYEEPGEGQAPPNRLFLKIAPAAVGQRLFATLFALGSNETNFYLATRGQLPVRVPEVHALVVVIGVPRYSVAAL